MGGGATRRRGDAGAHDGALPLLKKRFIFSAVSRVSTARRKLAAGIGENADDGSTAGEPAAAVRRAPIGSSEARIALFAVASLLGHAGLSLAMPSDWEVPPPPPTPDEISFMVMPPEPEPEPVVEVEPEPVEEPEPIVDEPAPIEDPEPVVEEPEPIVDEPEPVVEEPVDEPPTEEPPAEERSAEEPGDPDAPEDASDPAGDPQGSVSTSTEGGLAVARPAGSGRDGAARGTRRAGEGGGAEPAPAVDRRALIRAYMVRVQRALGAPRYTRSLLRAGLAGSVLVALRIDPAGHVLGVRVHRSSGEPLLDEAALAHARATAEVPAPPEALRWTTREVVLPVRYVLRQR